MENDVSSSGVCFFVINFIQLIRKIRWLLEKIFKKLIYYLSSTLNKVFYVSLLFIWSIGGIVPADTAFAQEQAGSDASLRGQTERIRAHGLAVTVSGNKTYFTMVLSKQIQAQFYALMKPNRIVIDLPEVEFHVPAHHKNYKGGAISSLRFGLFSQGHSRVVLELKEPSSASALQGRVVDQEGVYYYTLELKPVSFQDFKKFSEKHKSSVPVGDVLTQFSIDEKDKRPVIVIDPGHGGVDTGAMTSTGVQEKDIVFSFALKVAEKLRESGKFQIVMTRERDVFIPLGERVRIAQKVGADLLISIHADSISEAPQVRGFTVYTVSQKASDRESAILADRENQSDNVAGIVASEVKEQVVDILQDLTLRETRILSQVFAQSVIEHFGSVMRLNKNPHRQAGFHVLKAYDVPSILIELGYMSSQKDIDLLTSEKWRDEASNAVVLAIVSFLEKR